MKFTLYLEQFTRLMLHGEGALVFGWVEEIPGAYVYGKDELQVQREAETQITATLDWLIEHDEPYWKSMAETAKRGMELECRPLVRPILIAGPQPKHDPFQLGVEEYPLTSIDISRLITLSSYALSDLDRIRDSISEEEWLMPLCDGRVTASAFGDVFSEVLLVGHVWRMMQMLGLKPKEVHFMSGYTGLMQTYQAAHGIDSQGRGQGERVRWTWRHDALRMVMEECLREISTIPKLPGLVINAEIWTLRKILLIRQWTIRITTEKLIRRAKPRDVADSHISLSAFTENLDYIGILSSEHADFWITTVISLMRAVGNATDENLERLCNLLLGYFEDSTSREDTVPKSIQQEVRSLRGPDYYEQEDEIGLKYQCLAAVCWEKAKIASDEMHFMESITMALERIVRICGDEQSVISMLRARLAENSERWPDNRWKII